VPARVWLLSGAIVALGVLGFIILVIAVPDPIAIRPSPPAPAPAVAGEPATSTRPSPELVADVAAVAATRQAVLPATHVPVPNGPTVMTLVTAAETQLTFAYEVEIDPPEYVLRADPAELYPGLEARSCSTNTSGVCFVVTPAFAAAICADPELRGLIDRGAVVRALFRDINRRPLADTTVRAANCG
jgi:hypothetical protein